MKLKSAYYWIGATLSILLLFACVFWRERIYGDSSALLFWIVNGHEFITAHNRPTVLVIEYIPLLMSYAHVPLRNIIIGFSVGEWFWYALCVAALLFIFKDVKAAIGVLLVYLIGIRYNYFNPVSELTLAVPFVFMFFSFVHRTAHWHVKQYIIATLLMSGVLFSHPLHMLLFPALYIFDRIVRREYSRPFFVLFFLLLVLEGIRYLLLDNYDRSPMQAQQQSTSLAEFREKFLRPAYFKDAGLAYISSFTLIALTVWHFFKKKQKLHAALFLFFCLAYWAFVNFKVGFLYPDSFEPYERYLLPIPITVAFAFVYYVLDLSSLKHLSILTAILFVQTLLLLQYGRFVSNRFDQMEMAIENAYQFPQSKFIYRKANYYYRDISPRLIGHCWIQTQESILLSAIRHPQDPRQVFVKEILPDDFYNKIDGSNYLNSPDDWLKDYSELDTFYFPMHKTGLRRANTDTLQSHLPDSFFTQIKIRLHSEYKKLKRKRELLPYVKIENHSTERLLYSGAIADGICISYRWLDVTGIPLSEEWTRTTPLQCDVKKSINQQVLLRTPDTAGKYVLEWQLFFEQGKLTKKTAGRDNVEIE